MCGGVLEIREPVSFHNGELKVPSQVGNLWVMLALYSLLLYTSTAKRKGRRLRDEGSSPVHCSSGAGGCLALILLLMGQRGGGRQVPPPL